MSALKSLFSKLPAPARSAFAAALSLAAGIAVAVMIDYLLYRIGFPSKPFIYVSF